MTAIREHKFECSKLAINYSKVRKGAKISLSCMARSLSFHSSPEFKCRALYVEVNLRQLSLHLSCSLHFNLLFRQMDGNLVHSPPEFKYRALYVEVNLRQLSLH